MTSDSQSKLDRFAGEGALKRFKGFTHANVADKYNELADEYELAMSSLDFPDPELCAQKISQLSFTKDVEILDVGAGTGFVGEALSKQGFSRITARDGSSHMLQIAAKKGVYQHLHECVSGHARTAA